jgi:hypothetical protein
MLDGGGAGYMVKLKRHEAGLKQSGLVQVFRLDFGSYRSHA